MQMLSNQPPHGSFTLLPRRLLGLFELDCHGASRLAMTKFVAGLVL
jgi:hypothetical protein